MGQPAARSRFLASLGITNRGRNDKWHGMTLTDFGANHIESLRRSRVLDTAHASDRIERIAVEFSQLPVSVCDVDRNDLPDHEAAASGGRREIENLIELALEADRRFRDSRRLHDLRRRVIDVGKLELVDGSIVFTAGRIHRFGEFERDHVDHKFFGLADIAQRVFGFSVGRGGSLRRTQSWGKRQQRRLDANAIEKREWSKVWLAGGAESGNPGDRPGSHSVENESV